MEIKRRLIGGVFVFVMTALTSCGGGGSGVNNDQTATADFPVDEPFAAALVSKGMPSDIARYFAAAKLSYSCASTTDCTYRYTYPNGATRDRSVSATPNQQYTPTADELAATALIGNPVYDGKFTASGVLESTPSVNTQIALSYFVPTTSILGGTAVSAAVRSRMAAASVRLSAAGPNDGFRLNSTETSAKGVDVSIGTVLDYYQKLGTSVKAIGAVYAMASALSDISGAMALSQEVKAWLAELDALEKCAANPTNSVAQSDPSYSANTVARLQSARVELKQISAVRFMNMMDETAEGIHPATAVLGIPLKSIHSWTEQTLKTAGEKLMKDARSSVVSCVPSCPTSLVATGVSESQINLSWSGAMVTDRTLTGYNITGGNTAGATTTATSWSDTGLARSKTYCYTVTAFNEYGASASCPQACGTTFGPPVVRSTGPFSDATGVPVTSAVTATFSKAVDPATVTAVTFKLARSGGAAAGAVSYSGTTAIFTPTSDLAYSTVYTATITTAVKDLDGTALEANYTWSFTTSEAAPLAGNVQFSTTVTDAGVNTTDGVANVTWTLSESLPDVRTYTASGTISGRLVPVLEDLTCDPLSVTSNLSTTNGLLIYTATNTAWPSTHAFVLTAEDMNTTLTTNCTDNSNGGSIPIQFSKLLYVFVGGACLPSTTPMPVPFTDEKKLSGNYSCPGATNFSGTSAAWSFAMP